MNEAWRAEALKEIKYCLELLRTRGDGNVSRDAIPDYLDVQSVRFTRMGARRVSAAFVHCRWWLMRGEEGLARKHLEGVENA